MPQEIELKLSIPDTALAPLAAWLDANGQAQGEATLLNVYLDTPQRDLAQARAALRLRRKGEQWLQTLKTAGSSQAGLATRHEWETEIAGEVIELQTFPAEAQTVLAPLIGRLAPVFRTDFVRRTWIVTQDGARIEAALDTGTITAPASASQEPIQELELEWLDGDAAHAADALRAFAARLAAVAALAPSDLSKAARGYRLAGIAEGKAS
ncbi:CYTH domain-containing protein [Cupriavidus taiwanensis]|uniref:CYTH domain-containing protein n=1 Tax=Cupriavidus taiwanensis TaxID=164546 RepID=UPI0025401C96|nr:CYTH domain-containing protein [Cupriavidus taiwanensis]MDK3025184.1 CYTH domain-containing protein [Cupriavidus taiwanensis]